MRNHPTHNPSPENCLDAGDYIESTHLDIVALAQKTVEGMDNDIDRAIALYLAVRDGISYTPYRAYDKEGTYLASTCLAEQKGCCVEKSALLAAAARSVGIAARVGYGNVKNHLSTPRLLDMLETDIFYWHGFCELWLNESWVKSTPVFDRALCDKMGVEPLVFDGVEDSLFQTHNSKGHPHMEYLVSHGSYNDVPAKLLMSEYARVYPKLIRECGEQSDFYKEVKSAR